MATPTVVPTPSPSTVSSTASTTNAAAARPIRESPPVTSQPSTRRVDYLQSALQERGLSKAAQDLWLSSRRSSTNATYDSAWRQFDCWCGEREIDCFSATPTVVSNFLSDEFAQRKANLMLNVYWSAIAMALPPSDGQPNRTAPGCLPCYAWCVPFSSSTAPRRPVLGCLCCLEPAHDLGSQRQLAD